MNRYESSVEINRVWADRLGAYAHLNSLAAQTNKPGNDVFQSLGPDDASAILDTKLAEFSLALADARRELRHNLAAETASPLLSHLDHAGKAMRAQVAEARSVFALVRSKDMKNAASKMAVMDRNFSEVSESLAFLCRNVRRFQQEDLELQASAAASLRRFEYLIAALITIMVSFAALYGYRMVKRANIEGQLRGLARGAQEHKARAEQHSQKLSAALAELRNQKLAMDKHAIVDVTDTRGRITYANDNFCRINQYSREELIGQDHRIVNSGHHPREFFADLWRTITAGETWHGEVCNRAKDGTIYWVDTTIVPFKDETGQITEFVAIRTDITTRVESRQRLIEDQAVLVSINEALETANASAQSANRAKSDFLANMSHEIRTPMTAILGFAENLLDPRLSESERIDCVGTIRRNGQFLLELINDILDLSKIEAGKITLERTPCSPCRTISEVESLMRVRAESKNLSLGVEFDGEIPASISCDPTRLRQILINLVGNAIKFTESGSIRIVLRLIDDGHEPMLQFDVIDTGRGITQEQLVTLFHPFSQAETSTTRKFGGTGLGLTISKRFAELLVGDITVTETKKGAGSTFRVTVTTGPLDGVRMITDSISAMEEINRVIASHDTMSRDLTGCRILLAEDGPDNQRLIAFVLKKAGAEVVVEENGQLAAETALAARDEGQPFDCILMDMQMPVMDGYEATRLLRGKGYTHPIIALTAHAMAGEREKCITAGCNDYATKPLDRKKLVELIRHHIKKPETAPTPVA